MSSLEQKMNMVLWYGMVWWYGMVVWYGCMVWYGMVCAWDVFKIIKIVYLVQTDPTISYPSREKNIPHRVLSHSMDRCTRLVS